jgi:hypothetical protein
VTKIAIQGFNLSVADRPYLRTKLSKHLNGEFEMSRKYQASNQNAAPAHARVEGWASVVEVMVNFALFTGLLVYIMLPAMLGQHVFATVTAGAPAPAEGNVVVSLSQDIAKGLLWVSALSIGLAGAAALHFIIWAGAASLRKPNFRFFVSSCLCVSVASGSIVRSAATKFPLPEGAEVPVLFLSGWVDIPGLAASGFVEGLHLSVLAPFTLVGVIGIILALYRIGKARIDRKLEAYLSKR